MTLAALTLTTPAMLAGIALIGLPILAHLMFRRARRKITFPTIRLLAEATATQSNLFQMRKWIVLALRCLAVMFIAYAFARPMWVDADTEAATGDGATVAIVIDASASTAQQVNGLRLFDDIKARAGRILDELTPGKDFAIVIAAGRTPRKDFPDPIANLGAIRDDLAAMEPTQERADLSAAVASAVATLTEQPGVRRLVVISDMQRSNWADLVIDDALLRQSKIAATVIAVGEDEPANVGLSDVRTDPPHPVAGSPAIATVTASNHSPDERTVTVYAAVDGKPVGSKRVVVPARSSAPASFEITFDRTAGHALSFTTDPDALSADNAAFAVVESVDRVGVLVVTDDDVNDPTGSSFYLVRALAPRGDTGDRLDVRTVDSASLDASAVADAQVVVLGDTAALTDAGARALGSAIRSGRGVIWFTGDGPLRQSMASLALAAGDDPILPWRAQTLRDPGRRGEALRISGGSFSSPPLNVFDDRAQLALSRIGFYRSHTTVDPNADAFTLLSFSDTTPALSLTTHGRGKLLVANFGVAPRNSDLGKRGVFVALLHALVDHVRPRSGATAALTVGSPIVFAIEAPDGARIHAVGPEGIVVPVSTSLRDGTTSVRLAMTPAAGLYSVYVNGRLNRQLAVNLEARESDLRRIDPSLVRDRFGGDAADVDVVDPTGRASLDMDGTPLWHWLVVAAMAAMGLEMVFLSVYRR